MTKVTGGNYHACAKGAGPELFCWGRNRYGEVGDGTTTTRNTPVQVTVVDEILDFSVGGYHTCVLRQDGTVRCFGDNSYGGFGMGNTSGGPTPRTMINVSDVIELSAAHHGTCVRQANQEMYCAGWYYHVGTGNNANQYTPQRINLGGNVRRMFSGAGVEGAAAQREDGTFWTWGQNRNGQLGVGSTTEHLSPVRVSDF
jgi:alpha-tubulin suppressor-like RCC1 family protein